MSKRDKRRRNAQRQQQGSAGAPDQAQTAQSAEERRARQIREWEQRKKAKEQKGSGVSGLVWAGAGMGVAVVAVIGVVLLQSGGGDSSDENGGPTATVDARVRGLPIESTVELSADDSGQSVNPIFVPNFATGKAGTVIEFKLRNDGSVAHNLNVSGPDKEYGTPDDFFTRSLQPGEETSLLVKLDVPGVYPFRCDLHPLQQTGELTITG